MASRIQGITVEIGGDTTKLSKALEGVNKSIKGTQSGLKDVNKLLKLDPSNTELVIQKQKMLKDAIQATKEKLATLKTAAQQANEQLANGEITQQQYDALQREIAETEQNLKSLQEQAATTNATLAKIDEAGEKLQNLGSSVENVGKKFLPVTAAVTGLGTAAVKTAADFDAEMSKVSAISGATGDDFDKLRAKAREMGAKTKFSASEAASAMEYMAMAGWRTEDMLSGIEGIMNLAAASGEDLATTSDIVTDALTAFGLSAADSGHFADILAAASSSANTNVSMMGETFKYCAPIAGALGFSAEDTAEAIGLMANSGIYLVNLALSYEGNDLLIDSIQSCFFINLNFKLLEIPNNVKNRLPNLRNKYPEIEELEKKYEETHSEELTIQLGEKLASYFVDAKFMAGYWKELLDYLEYDPTFIKQFVATYNARYKFEEDITQPVTVRNNHMLEVKRAIVRDKIRNFWKK